MEAAEGGRNGYVGMRGERSAATGRLDTTEPGHTNRGSVRDCYLLAGVGEDCSGTGPGGGTRRQQAQGTGETVMREEADRVGGKDLSRKNLADSDPWPFKRSHSRPPQGT